jgi:oligopeptide/dipeptide ABC transporter ATP-binding protein
MRRGESEAVHALEGINILLDEGEALGIVGESGAGKTTLAALITGLDMPTSGELKIDGQSFQASRDKKEWARNVQLVWQDPPAAIDPRQRIGAVIAEPLIIQGIPRGDAMSLVRELMLEVGLDDLLVNRLPHELSGGQAQRAVIARALAVNPRLVICDEPASALDAQVKVQIADLLVRLRRERGLAYMVIAHDLPLVRKITDSIAVMYRGVIVEQGPTQVVLGNPLHPYTQLLVNSDLSILGGQSDGWQKAVTTLEEKHTDKETGCPFFDRCSLAVDRCAAEVVTLLPVGDQQVACCLLQD